MAFYQVLTSARSTPPDIIGLVAALRTAIAADVGVQVSGVGFEESPQYTLKKGTVWTPAEIATAQGILDTHPAWSEQLAAQHAVDRLPLEYKALVLALIDALNVVRAGLPTPLPAITPLQALKAIRDKAALL